MKYSIYFILKYQKTKVTADVNGEWNMLEKKLYKSFLIILKFVCLWQPFRLRIGFKQIKFSVITIYYISNLLYNNHKTKYLDKFKKIVPII